MRPGKTVVVSFTRMGDLIQTGPLMRAMKEACPDSELVLLVLPDFFETAARLPMVDQVLAFDVDGILPGLDAGHSDLARAYRQLSAFVGDHRLAAARLVVNLSHTRQSAVLTGLLGGNRHIGLYSTRTGRICASEPWYWYLLSVIADRTPNPFNLVEIYLRLAPNSKSKRQLELTVECKDESSAKRLASEHGVRLDQPFFVLQLGASSASRCWPVERFAEVGNALGARGCQVIAVGSQSEMELAGKFSRLSRTNSISLVGKTTFGQLAAILHHAQALITNDTGTMHVAAAVGTRVIGVFVGPAAAKDTGPYGDHHIVIEPELACHPCSYQHNCSYYACHDLVSAEHVARLATAEGRRLGEAVQAMSGVRVWKTAVSDEGEFELLPLNQGARQAKVQALRYVRRFWNALIDGEDGGIAVDGEPINHIRVKEDCLQELVNARSRFHQCVQVLRQHVAANRAAPPHLAEVSREFALSLEELADAAVASPPVSAFARVIHIGASMLRSDDISSSFEDLSRLDALLYRGLNLLSPGTQFARKSPAIEFFAA